MQPSRLGPKVVSNQTQVEVDEDIPEEPDDELDVTITCKIKVKYKKTNDRYDKKGRRIAKGTGYGICFDNFITVCVFDSNDEVVQIQETLSQFDQQKLNPHLDQKFKTECGHNEMVLLSILKKKQS